MVPIVTPTTTGESRVFRERGAYARFKDFLAEKGRLEEWYAFEAARTEKALREWCAENDVTLVAESRSD